MQVTSNKCIICHSLVVCSLALQYWRVIRRHMGGVVGAVRIASKSCLS